ncbi:hypothetical protein UFOVP420_24 [uncultured Caudovirales phage]|uniref:Uncharacterized protein n=1 Tax=uncultured Caudovirales phage TaxID=2100421 RepID=A0A6J5M3U0_9CAUD|nr:hypothetical protein UFOVP420_24 [uncultured Caudovirales phage]
MPSIINSDDGVVSGSSGLKTTGGNDGITNFQQNGTTQATITAAGLFQFNSGYGSVATAYGCRAWVNFNGTSTVAIRASGNVTSITDNGTGDYTVNFTTAMPDANYTMAGSLEGTSDPGSVFPYTAGGTGTAPTLVTTTQYRMRTTLSTDANFISVAFHR